MNDWVEVGSTDWLRSVPTVIGTVSSPTLVVGDKFSITVDSTVEEITIPSSPTVQLVADLINASDVYPLGITAEVTDEKLVIYSAQEGTNMSFALANVTGTPLTSMGIKVVLSINLKQCMHRMQICRCGHQVRQCHTQPVQCGLKLVLLETSLTTALAVYNATTGSYTNVNVPQAQTDWEATASIDSTGGMAIPADSVYAQYGTGSIYLWKRIATGATVVTGTTDGVKYCQTDSDYVQLTNWRKFDYIANEGAPKKDPVDGTPWFYSYMIKSISWSTKTVHGKVIAMWRSIRMVTLLPPVHRQLT
ncbi:hypothetical protein GHT06_001833 [Daphnia sinensis]|uniref:Uncharacterized protein n=1 Tax=Daphnia sinensis TaxID=1820382 RepID=A0AAD5PL90_9CRUS|nr:hypothetical protein GHT06_001833 [Daphnia sinensis]